MDISSRGQIITFYSYKGGTGRSMALANIACILADQQTTNKGKGVLMIDWDLEAPGLHRYFRNRLVTRQLGIDRIERSEFTDSKLGLIDLFISLDQEMDRQAEKLQQLTTTTSTEGTNPLTVVRAEDFARSTIEAINLDQFILSTTISGLDLIKAGRFNPKEPNEYSQRVNKFNWETLYRKSPQLIRMLAERLAEDYAYVLIDSRTGITDISGVCTMILPEKLVVVFTPNLQSLRGGMELIKQATTYRKESADLRPLMVFPLVSRVEANEPDLRHDWRFGNKEFDGYQLEIETLLQQVYENPRIRLDKYFDEMQIQHIPRYAYGEEIAFLIEKVVDAFSLRRRYQTFAKKLAEGQAPWEGEIKEYVSDSAAPSALTSLAESFFDIFSLSGATRQARSFVALLLLALVIGASLIAYFQFHKAQVLTQSQQKLLVDNAELRKRVDSLEDPIKGILKENNDRIAELTQQANSVTQERDTARADLKTQSDALAKAQDQLRNAAGAQKALQVCQDGLTQARVDSQSADDARKDALYKYNASQAEVRKLQAQLAKCR